MQGIYPDPPDPARTPHMREHKQSRQEGIDRTTYPRRVLNNGDRPGISSHSDVRAHHISPFLSYIPARSCCCVSRVWKVWEEGWGGKGDGVVFVNWYSLPVIPRQGRRPEMGHRNNTTHSTLPSERRP